jgi:hypothetical protein
MRRAAIVLSILGAVALVIGAGMMYAPAAWVMGGLLALGGGMFLLPADRRRE